MFAQKKVTLPKGRHKIIILDEADRSVGCNVFNFYNKYLLLIRRVRMLSYALVIHFAPTSSNPNFPTNIGGKMGTDRPTDRRRGPVV